MLAAQALYGPHAEDVWSDEAVALGRRLWRRLPEDAFDRQPLVGGGGRFALVADLRLDNRVELEGELGVDAARAPTISDAALLLDAWERWGGDCVDHLVGDYAFAVWDRDRRELVLARDPFGARPLHYHRRPGFFAFASMPKGLQALPEIPTGPDEIQMLDFVALAPEAGSRSFFEGVERVEIGGMLTVTADAARSRRHWRPVRKPIRLGSFEDYAEGLRRHLDQAVHARLRGAGPSVGAHLSAGLDSSAVTATAARLTAASGGRVVAFTAVPREGYAGPSPRWRFGDEGAFAAATASLHPNIEHVPVRVAGKSPLETLDRDFYLYDRPLLNLCNYTWLHEINRLARERSLSVMLVGTNGNLGLSYDGLDLLPELAARGRLSAWLRAGAALKRNGVLKWRGIVFRTVGQHLPGALWDWANKLRGVSDGGVTYYSALNPARKSEVERRRRAAGGRGGQILRGRADTFQSRIDNLTWTDPGNYIKGALAGWGLDVRDPTSDRRLIEFCLNVPLEIFLHGGMPRALARKAFADRLPASVLEERRRGYQAIDWHENLTHARPQLIEILSRLDASSAAQSVLDLPRMHRLAEHWPTGGWEQSEVMSPYRLALLRGVSVGHFLHRATGSNA
jgi:asparagine synthase (glutamine-hydrolysing)